MSVPTIPTLVSRIAELARDKKSLQVRCATLLRVCLTGTVPATRIAIVRGEAHLEPTLIVARLIEREGRVPVVRWARDAEGVITGIAFSVVQTEDEAAAPVAPGLREMACVDGESDGWERALQEAR